jgi:competence protein ComEC
MLQAPLLALFVAAVAGIGVAEALAGSPAPWAAASVGGVAAVAWALRRGRGTLLAAVVACFALYGFVARDRRVPPAPPTCGAEGLFLVDIDAPVSRQPGPDGMHRQATAGRLVAEHCAGDWALRQGRVRLVLWEGDPVLRGDRVALRLRLEPFAPPRNPTDPDPALRARHEALVGRAHVRSAHALVRAGTGPLTRIDRLRLNAALAFERDLPSSSAALAKALALGDTGGLSTAQRDAWAAAGVAHLLAVSGLHVALVCACLGSLSRRLLGCLPGVTERTSVPRLAAAVGMVGVALYTLLTGGSPAALRAAVMTGTALLGVLLGHRASAANGLGLAGLLLLAAAPLALYHPGFLLSFAAVLGLLAFPQRRVRAQGPRAWVGTALALSTAATLATLPITAAFFGQVPWLGPLVNLVVVPVGSGLATPLALAEALLASLWAPASALVGVPLGGILGGLDGVAAWVAAWPAATLGVPPPRRLETLLYGLLLAALAATWRRRAKAGKVAVACAVALSVCLGTRLWPSGPASLRVEQVYVGQGDAALVTLPAGGVILVDGGGAVHAGERDPGRHVLVPLLAQRGVRRLQRLVVTHPHPDHLHGLVAVAARWPVGELYWNGRGADIPAMQALQAAVRARGGAVLGPDAIPSRGVWEGVQYEAWMLAADDASLNDSSLVLRLQYGQRSILLTGDIEARAEAALAARLPPADLLKAPHHGSQTSSTEALLRAVAPRAVIISCGDHNRFGFPHAPVLARYARLGIDTWRTDEDGRVLCETDGVFWYVEGLRGRRATYAGSEIRAPSPPSTVSSMAVVR